MNEHEELEMYRAYVSTHFSLDFAAFRTEWRQNHPEIVSIDPTTVKIDWVHQPPELVSIEEPVKKRSRKRKPRSPIEQPIPSIT
jgi:hypothetical protein